MLARQLQLNISDKEPVRQFKINHDSIILGFRNTPEQSTIQYLHWCGYKTVEGHKERKFKREWKKE